MVVEGKRVGSLVVRGRRDQGSGIVSPASLQDHCCGGLGALALGTLLATVGLAFPRKCHFRELQWSTDLNHNLDFLFFF